jgi:integration host factor subunit alpha
MAKKLTPLTRAELVQMLRERMSLSSKDAGMILESVLDIITEGLTNKTPVSIMGLGRFEVRSTPDRPGRNPKTGDFAPVTGRLRPSFSMSKRMRDKMSFFLESDEETYWDKDELPDSSAESPGDPEGSPGVESGDEENKDL